MRSIILLTVVLLGCDAAEGPCSSAEGPPPYGGLIFTEIMAAPSGEPLAEWVELRNVLPWSVDPDGLRIVTGDTQMTLECEGVVAPGAVFVAAASADPGLNGGLEVVHCRWSGGPLPNQAVALPGDPDVAARTNRLQLQAPGGALIDDVPYLVPGVDFPTVQIGASMELCAELLSVASNDHGYAWHTAEVASGITSGDLATPGMVGLSCGLDQAVEEGR